MRSKRPSRPSPAPARVSSLLPERAASWLLAIALWAVALAMDTSLHNQSLPKTLALYILLPVVAALIPTRGRPFRPSPAAWASMALVGWLLAGALVIAPSGALVDALEEWARWMSGGVLAWIAATLAFRVDGGAAFLFRAWAIAGVVSALYGFVQILAPGLDFVEWGKRDRLFSTLANPTFAAGFYAALLPWAAFELALVWSDGRGAARSRRWRLRAAFAVACFAILSFALLLTFSRGGWLAAGAGLGAFAGCALLLGATRRAFLDLLRELLGGHRAALPALAALALAAGALALTTWPGLFQASQRARLAASNPEAMRLAEGPEAFARTLNVRRFSWNAAREAFLEKPWTGHGPGMYQRLFPTRKGPEAWRSKIGDNTTHAHSEPAELACEAGFVGLFLAALALGLWAGGLGRFLGREGIDPLAALGACALGACALATVVDSFWGVHWRWTTGAVSFWLPAGLAWGWARRLAAGATPAPNSPAFSGLELAVRLAPALVLAAFAAWQGYSVSKGSYLLRQGELWLLTGDEERALAYCRRAIESNPWLLEARYREGNMLARLERPEEALRAWSALRKLDAPDYASLARNEARALVGQGELREAERRWRDAEAQDRDPENAIVAATIADAWPPGEPLPASLRLEESRFLETPFPALGAIAKAAAETPGGLAQARAWLLEAIRRDPAGKAWATLSVASWLSAEGRPELAVELIEFALSARAAARAPWPLVLAEAGPEELQSLLEEEGRLRQLRAKALEAAFHAERTNLAAPMSFEERLELRRIRDAYEDARLWWPRL